MANENSLIHNRYFKKNQLTEPTFLSEGDFDFDPREEFDNTRSPQNISDQLQVAVDEIIRRCPDVDWNENFLSYQVVSAIRFVLGGYRFSNTEYYPNISKFDIEAYKLSGQAEQNHGDIAVVVTRLFHRTDRTISGVGFYEAKASSNGWNYPAFSFQQLRTLVTNTPRLSYLLYSRNPEFADTQEWLKSQRNEKFGGKQFYARTVDANFVKQYKSLGQAAHLISQSFGYHFVQKILSGRELDYSRPPIETIRRWLKVTRRTTALVVSIAVQESEDKHISAQLQLPSFEKLVLQNPDNNGSYMLSDNNRLA